MTVADIISALRAEVTEDGHILLDKLQVELKLYFWPGQVFDAAVESFGPVLNNPKSRNRLSLDRVIRRALSVWANRCGGQMNPEQEKYASSVLCAAIRGGEEAWEELGKPASPTKIACVVTRIGDMVEHEKVHEGFKRRSGRIDRSGELKQMLAEAA